VIPLTRAVGLYGIAQAATATRDAIDVVLRQRAVQTGAAALAAESALRGASASARLEQPNPAVDEGAADERLKRGALRATDAAAELAGLWRTAPLQVLARLHLLAAADLAGEESLGRPRDATAARRLTGTMAEIARSTSPGSVVPAVVVAALVHAEAAEAFAPAGGLVGRAAERVVLLSTGVDPTGVLVPEEGHLAEPDDYLGDRRRLLTGTDVAVATWVERCLRAYTSAADVTASMLAARS
jgi:hypothetical protein